MRVKGEVVRLVETKRREGQVEAQHRLLPSLILTAHPPFRCELNSTNAQLCFVRIPLPHFSVPMASFPLRFSSQSSSFPSSSSSFCPPPTPDEAIRSTDSDAALSRLLVELSTFLPPAAADITPSACSSAVSLSYLDDPFASLFIKGRPPRESYRRPPLINIGTHARTLGVDELVMRFLKGPGKKGGQIVSLGAGSDTRFWRLMVSSTTPSLFEARYDTRDGQTAQAEWIMSFLMPLQSNPELKSSVKKYVEIDFEEITSKKAAFIKRSKVLSDVLGPEITIGELSLPLRSLYEGADSFLCWYRRAIRNPPSLPRLLPSPSRPPQSSALRPDRTFNTDALDSRVPSRLPRSSSQRKARQMVRGEVRRVGRRGRVRDVWAQVSSFFHRSSFNLTAKLSFPTS